MNLTDLQIDYIKELFNISLGSAAVELSELVEDEVELSVPSFSLLSCEALIEKLGLTPETPVTAVKMKTEGGLEGDAMLLFPADNSLDLVKAVVGEVTDDDDLTELEAEALTEVASIILNHIITTICSMLSMKVKTRLPTCINDTLGQILIDKQDVNTVVMFVGMSFSVKQLNLSGDVLFIQDLTTVEEFVQRVAEVLSELGLE